MRHRKHTFKIGRTSSHRKALLANMVCSLFQEGRIQTTVTKAKEARRLAEKMITLGKRGTLHDRRRAIAVLRQPNVVAKMFADIAPLYQERNGGYTRILKLGRRKGDAA
jgi:large subunit ribosomal protein L17